MTIWFCQSSWNFTEEQQEAGGFCGGGSRGAAVAWGTQNGFVSLSGDAGQSVRLLLAAVDSTTENTTVADASSFPIVLSEGATFSESGNLCLPINLPTNYTSGAHATLYAEATGDGETVSSCAEVVLVPADSGASAVSQHGSSVSNPAGGNYTTYDYYCSNGTIPALDTCSCHCHGDHGHCGSTCSEERVAQSNAECAAAAYGSSLPASSAASSTPAPTATGSTGAAAESSTTGGSNGAGKFGVSVAAVLAVAGVVALQ
ncbi:hypothetical protein JCM8097_005351 [Rhodosporidiobolus ruineniae]